MPDLTKWVGKSSNGKFYDYEGNKYYCDRCQDEQATVAIDMYYNDEYWCQECCDKSEDSEPKYDAVTAEETRQKSNDDRQKLRGG